MPGATTRASPPAKPAPDFRRLEARRDGNFPSEGLGDRAACQIQGAESTKEGVVVREEAQVEDGERADSEDEVGRL